MNEPKMAGTHRASLMGVREIEMLHRAPDRAQPPSTRSLPQFASKRHEGAKQLLLRSEPHGDRSSERRRSQAWRSHHSRTTAMASLMVDPCAPDGSAALVVGREQRQGRSSRANRDRSEQLLVDQNIPVWPRGKRRFRRCCRAVRTAPAPRRWPPALCLLRQGGRKPRRPLPVPRLRDWRRLALLASRLQSGLR